MKPSLEKKIRDLRDVVLARKKLLEPFDNIYDEVRNLEREIEAKYREIAEEFGIEYCKHDELTLDRLIAFMESQT